MKVVIIGAGPAGLTAAYELLTKHREYEVVVLEKTAAIGGISKTVCHNGNRMDIGGHRFFFPRTSASWIGGSTLCRCRGLPRLTTCCWAVEMPLHEGGPDPQREDRVMLLRNRVSRIYYQGHFFDYPVSLKWKTLKAMGLVTTLKVGFSYLYSVFHKLPETSLENFYINSFGRKLYSMFFESYTEKLWGRHPSVISAEWGAQRTKGLSIRGVLADMMKKLFLSKDKRKQSVQTSLIEEFRYPKFGPRPTVGDGRGRHPRRRRGCASRLRCNRHRNRRWTHNGCTLRSEWRRRTHRGGRVFLIHAGQGSHSGHGRNTRGYQNAGRRTALPRFHYRGAAGQSLESEKRNAVKNAGQYYFPIAGSIYRTMTYSWGACRFSITGRRICSRIQSIPYGWGWSTSAPTATRSGT